MIGVRPRLVHDVVRGELTDGEVVVSLRGGERALILNAMGGVVLELCDGSRTIDEIAEFMRLNMSVPSNVNVAGDVGAVIEELVRAGVVEKIE